MKAKRGKTSMTSKLYLLAGVCVAGLVIFGVVAFKTLNTVKVNGPHYAQIIEYKDLLADVLPPPNYIVETYLTAQQMREAKSREQLDELLKRYAKLKEEYQTRQDYWRQHLEEGPLKTELTETSRKPAEAFFGVIDSELVPALEKGDAATIKEVFETKLPELYAK